MKPWNAAFALVVATMVACACQGDSAERRASANESTVVGELLLPRGEGSRGVEVVVTSTEAGGEARRRWVLFDEQGRFVHTFKGSLSNVAVSTGIRAELVSFDAEDLPKVDPAGRINLGVIDLRERLTTHHMVIRAADGVPPSDVRVAMCFGLPPVGPQGEPISLGSRQFPSVKLGSEVEWLVPYEAESIHFLVEWPIITGQGVEWRGGEQRLFGPFTTAKLPSELVMD